MGGWTVYTVPSYMVPTHRDGDVIVAAGNLHRKGVVDMDKEFYTNIGFTVVWCMKYIFIPIGVALTARILADKLLLPQPDRQKKKRSNKNRFIK
jgi:hypothetical protein